MLREIYKALKGHQSIELADVGTNVGIKEKTILALISNTPNVSVKDMSEMIGTTQRQCERIIAKMKADGLIRRVGATKNGHWEIIE